MDISILIKLRFPIMVFLLLWANIDSGYWNLREYDTPIQMVHAFRAIMPYVLFPLGFILHRMRPRLGGRYNPVSWLEAYGWIALFASMLSQHPLAAFYFGMAFMANVYVPQLFFYRWRDIRSERVLLSLTWLILGAFTLGILLVAREKLFVGYGITGLYKEGVEGMAMSRSSGIARFFGVTGLLALCKFWGQKGKSRVLWLLPMILGAAVVWGMQSRGAMIGFVAGVLFLFLLSRVPKFFYILFLVAIVGVYVVGYDKILIKRVEKQVRRGQDNEQLESMSGRTKSYKIAVRVIADNLFIGQGNWADRMSGAGHVHNTYLQALLNAGIIGFIPFVISWIMGWRLYFMLSRWRDIMEPEDRQLFLEAGIVMVFFTVRSIPETTTASFSVASMVMVSVYLYMVVLYERLKEQVEEGA